MLSARLCRELATCRGVLNNTRELLASSRGLATSCKRMRLSRSEVKAAKFLLQRFVFKNKKLVCISLIHQVKDSKHRSIVTPLWTPTDSHKFC